MGTGTDFIDLQEIQPFKDQLFNDLQIHKERQEEWRGALHASKAVSEVEAQTEREAR